MSKYGIAIYNDIRLELEICCSKCGHIFNAGFGKYDFGVTINETIAIYSGSIQCNKCKINLKLSDIV